jgi:hypothetical protein
MAEESDKLTLADGDAAAIATLSTILGFPIPATIAKNVVKGLGGLIAGAFDIPMAYLDAWAAEIRSESRARIELTSHAVAIATKEISGDPKLAARATANLGRRLLREQRTREKIAADVIGDLKSNPPQSDATAEIDSDWLHLFARHAETKTNADVQAYFAKVLAGEIRKPGTFSPETIEVLARLSASVGELFQRYCGLTMDFGESLPLLWWDPVGDPNFNMFAVFGFPYAAFCRLQDAGLLRPTSSQILMPPAAFQNIRIGRKVFRFHPTDAFDPKIGEARQAFNVMQFTAAGAELWHIVHITPDDEYVKRFHEWLKRLHLTPRSDN